MLPAAKKPDSKALPAQRVSSWKPATGHPDLSRYAGGSRASKSRRQEEEVRKTGGGRQVSQEEEEEDK